MRQVLVEAVNVLAHAGVVNTVKVRMIKVGDKALVVTSTVENAVPPNY